MSPELRHLIDRSKFHKAAVVAVAALLPKEDSELDALIAESVKAEDQNGFCYLTVAAVASGRPVDARHLARGATMFNDGMLLGIVAWHTYGEVPEALLSAMHDSKMGSTGEVAMMLLIALWCREHGGRALPNGLIAHARAFSRSNCVMHQSLTGLTLLSVIINDAGLRAVVMEKISKMEPIPIPNLEALLPNIEKVYLAMWRTPVLEYIPQAPSRELAQGSTMRRSVVKVGRNDPCPCGSGRKHKNCCIEKDKERLRFSTDVAGKTVEELNLEPEQHLTPDKLIERGPHEAALWDPRKLKPELLKLYFEMLVCFRMRDRAVEALELLGWTKELEERWETVLVFVSEAQRKDLALRVLKVRPESDPIEGDLPMLTALLLVDDDPGKMMEILDERAMKALGSDDMAALEGFASAVMTSKFRSIGIFVARSMIPVLPQDKASRVFELLLEARDKLNLPPEDPFGDILDERFRKDDAGEGKEADALREAQQRLDANAKEVVLLKEGLDRLHQEIQQREQAPAPTATVAAPVPVPVDEPVLRELRRKMEEFKSTINEGHNERNELRRELQKAHADLEVLRHKSPALVPKAGEARDGDEDEEALFLPGETFIHQPVRIIEFPKHFHEGLTSIPKAVARGTLTMLGRLAAGEPAAFVGVVRLKMCHGIFRQRIGIDFRLLFKLLPDRVQVVDLVPRQDLLRRIKTLQ